MTLYEADLDKIAVPVKSVKRKEVEKLPKVRKPRVKKVKIEETVETISDAFEKSLDEPPAKKQRKRKLSEEKKEEKIEIATVQTAADPVAETVKDTVKETVAETTQETVTETAPEKPVKEKKQRAPRQKKDPTQPPQWFAKYVEGVKKEQATIGQEKVPAKKLKEEASEAAAKSWNNGLTRNRVQNEVDSHMSRMYCNLIINNSNDIFKIKMYLLAFICCLFNICIPS